MEGFDLDFLGFYSIDSSILVGGLMVKGGDFFHFFAILCTWAELIVD